MKKREIIMLSILTFLSGIVLGFVFSPVKQGIININGNTTNNHFDKKDSTDN